jgi:hypothetical protein
MRRTAVCTSSDYKTNLDAVKELDTQPVMEFRENYRADCRNYILPIPPSVVAYNSQLLVKWTKIFGEMLQT